MEAIASVAEGTAPPRPDSDAPFAVTSVSPLPVLHAADPKSGKESLEVVVVVENRLHMAEGKSLKPTRVNREPCTVPKLEATPTTCRFTLQQAWE